MLRRGADLLRRDVTAWTAIIINVSGLCYGVTAYRHRGRASSPRHIIIVWSASATVLPTVSLNRFSNTQEDKHRTLSAALGRLGAFGTALGRHLGRLKMHETQCLPALGRRDGLERGYMGMPPCSMQSVFLDTALIPKTIYLATIPSPSPPT